MLPWRAHLLLVVPWLLLALTFLFSILLLALGLGGSEGKGRRVNFRESPLESTRTQGSQGLEAAVPDADALPGNAQTKASRPDGPQRTKNLRVIPCPRFIGSRRKRLPSTRATAIAGAA